MYRVDGSEINSAVYVAGTVLMVSIPEGGGNAGV